MQGQIYGEPLQTFGFERCWGFRVQSLGFRVQSLGFMV